jgi:microcystin degradation protein MlrC
LPKILIAGIAQEVSNFNPFPSTYDYFRISRGQQIIDRSAGKNSEIAGALSVFRKRSDVTVVPTYTANATSAGPLLHSDFERLSSELLESISQNASGVHGLYFEMHGSMATTETLDPEGYMLEKTREILGPNVPIVISLDIHGVLTAKMLRNVDGVAIYHTYPHVDFSDTGRRAAVQLLAAVDGAKPVIARVVVPALVRGPELITATGLFGGQIRYAEKVTAEDPKVLDAGFLIGNPFTDVPELCSQAVVVTNGDAELAARHATAMAEQFWPNREKMQATTLVPLEDSVRRAAAMPGPVMFTDAADAPSSGASGDSPAILAEMVRQNFPHKVLVPIVDPTAAATATAAGPGAHISVTIGGELDPRFTPLPIEGEVVSLSDGNFPLEKWPSMEAAGPTAVVQSGNYTVVIHSRPVNLVDRALFYANKIEPTDFHSIIVKSPFCEPEFFNDWTMHDFNVDAPGSTSADLKSLGHRNCARPKFPLDEGVEFTARPEIYSRH